MSSAHIVGLVEVREKRGPGGLCDVAVYYAYAPSLPKPTHGWDENMIHQPVSLSSSFLLLPRETRDIKHCHRRSILYAYMPNLHVMLSFSVFFFLAVLVFKCGT